MEEFFSMSRLTPENFIYIILIFLVLTGIGIAILKLLPETHHRIFDPIEYLPQDEIHSLKQLYYLSMMAGCFICILYNFIFQGTDFYYFAVLDVLISIWIAITADKSTWFRKVAIILIVPIGSLAYILFNISIIGILDFIHIPILIYFIKYYYDRFTEYTESNGLGITILLLFTIIFLSAINTIFVESKNPLDAFVMVSNAFTSNGYAVLGNSIAGKLNSIILVWSGFVISSVGTATLAFALSRNHYGKKLDEMQESIERLEELIKKNNE